MNYLSFCGVIVMKVMSKLNEKSYNNKVRADGGGGGGSRGSGPPQAFLCKFLMLYIFLMDSLHFTKF